MLLRSARMTACATCELPLVLEIESDGDDKMDSTSRGGASTTVAHTVPDDVHMSCGCHFHWYLHPYQTSLPSPLPSRPLICYPPPTLPPFPPLNPPSAPLPSLHETTGLPNPSGNVSSTPTKSSNAPPAPQTSAPSPPPVPSKSSAHCTTKAASKPTSTSSPSSPKKCT